VDHVAEGAYHRLVEEEDRNDRTTTVHRNGER
jgi:hypothetical protein